MDEARLKEIEEECARGTVFGSGSVARLCREIRRLQAENLALLQENKLLAGEEAE